MSILRLALIISAYRPEVQSLPNISSSPLFSLDDMGDESKPELNPLMVKSAMDSIKEEMRHRHSHHHHHHHRHHQHGQDGRREGSGESSTPRRKRTVSEPSFSPEEGVCITKRSCHRRSDGHLLAEELDAVDEGMFNFLPNSCSF